VTEWTPRMQQLSEEICRYALATGEMPTMAEMARRLGLSRTRAAQIWWRIEQWERTHKISDAIHNKRAQAGYLLAVLKDIERAARMAGRVYPWKTRWQGPKQQPEKPKQPKHPPNRGPIYRQQEPKLPREPRWEYRPRWVAPRDEPELKDCPACHGTGVIDHDWCPHCGGEATVKR
jgi:hypothetical protein